MITPEQSALLHAKLSQEHIKTRVQGKTTISYIEGWHAISEANRIFGFGNWNREALEVRLVAEKPRKIGQYNPRDGWGVSYIARVRITVGSIIRDGYGAGHGIDVDLGLAHESAIKEAETDAMKRALMTFGNPFGLALYDKKQANVEAVEDGSNSQAIQPQAPVASPLVRLLAAMKKSDSAISLGEWMNHPKVKSAVDLLNADDAKAFSEASKAQLESFEQSTPFTTEG